MPYLADTNILLRLQDPKSPDYLVVRSALEVLWERGERLYFTSQNLAEFWNVCTRPKANNGFGLTTLETDQRAKLIESKFSLLPDNEQVHLEWRRLVVQHSVCGVRVHDARLAAAMIVHGIPRLITLNNRDFERYSLIRAEHPSELAES